MGLDENGNWEPCSEGCRGWLHMYQPYEIEACDACERFKDPAKAHELAIIVHAIECGCQWPHLDVPDAAMAWMDSISHVEVGGLTHDEITAMEDLLDCRGVEFMDNLPKAIALCAAYFDKTKGKEHEIIKGLMTLLKETQQKIENEELKLKDFGSPPEPKIPSIHPNMKMSEILEAAVARFKDSSELDELIHEAMSEEASRINNSGVETQVAFLIGTYDPEDLQNMLFGRFQCIDPACPLQKEQPYHDHPQEKETDAKAKNPAQEDLPF